jgi:hypothetical protein
MPIMPTNRRALSRIDVRRRNDRATNSVVLEYAGKGLTFHDSIYGYGDGAFMVVSFTEMPFPPELRLLSEETGIPIEALDAAEDVRSAAVDALVAEGLVKAPQMLHEFASPEVFWHPWDLRELERRHVVALSRLVEKHSLAEREMRLRAAQRAPVVAMPLLPQAEVSLPPRVVPQLEIVRVGASPVFPSIPVVCVEIVARVEMAVAQARASELPQRLPGGARRGLQKLPRAQYVATGSGVLLAHESLAEAMRAAEALAMASSVVEIAVVDWDGEWPVVVRRYGEGGRTIYRVEDALKRASEKEEAA